MAGRTFGTTQGQGDGFDLRNLMECTPVTKLTLSLSHSRSLANEVTANI